MELLLVDSSVILDVLQDDPVWADWSVSILSSHADRCHLCINPIIYAEISVSFSRIEDLEQAVAESGFRMRTLPRESLFLAGKAYLRYRRRRGTKRSPLPDFFIGAHAAVEGMKLITRDPGRVRTYFPGVPLITPHMS